MARAGSLRKGVRGEGSSLILRWFARFYYSILQECSFSLYMSVKYIKKRKLAIYFPFMACALCVCATNNMKSSIPVSSKRFSIKLVLHRTIWNGDFLIDLLRKIRHFSLCFFKLNNDDKKNSQRVVERKLLFKSSSGSCDTVSTFRVTTLH